MAHRLVKAFRDDDISFLAAAIAFNALLALGPMIVLVVVVAGVIWKEQSAREAVLASLAEYTGPEVTSSMKSALASWRPDDQTSLWAAVASVAILLWVGTRLFANVQVALNRIWEADERRYSSFVAMIAGRLYGLGILLGLGLVLTVLLVARSAVGALDGVAATVAGAAEPVVSLAVLALTLFVVFRRLPDVRVSVRDAGWGAVLTALMMLAGTEIATMYIQHAAATSAYGAAGSAFVLILWLFYVALAFLVGAELTWVFRLERRGKTA